MTNFERIKNMNADEIAELLDISTVETCKMCSYKCEGACISTKSCKSGIKLWLESEV